MPAKKKALDLEASLDALEILVVQMESGDLTLDESLQAFEKGIKLTRECQKRISQAEQQVNILMQNQEELTLAAFDLQKDSTE